MNQISSYNELSDAIKGYLALYENHSFKNAIYAGGNTFRYDAKTSSSPDNVRIYGNWYHTHSESKKEVTHKWFALLKFNKDGKVTRINDFFDGKFDAELSSNTDPQIIGMAMAGVVN
mgnify:CR=1 FL=1